MESYKKKYEEMKAIVNSTSEKASKLEIENDKLKQELKGGRNIKFEERKLNRYESNKENLTEWNQKGTGKK